jgi:hypothetical protein
MQQTASGAAGKGLFTTIKSTCVAPRFLCRKRKPTDEICVDITAEL